MKILLILLAIFVSVQWWNGHKAKTSLVAQTSPNGFIQVAMPEGSGGNTVVILAPLNCPSAEAQRADALSEQLTRRGIRNVRTSSYSVSVTNPSSDEQAAVNRATSVLNGTIPAVFVNGMGKSNPSVEEIAFEYERTK